MVPNHPAMLRALLLAKQIAAKTDPGFGGVSIPIPGEPIPLARAAGGYVPHGSPERTQNLMEWFGNSVLHDNGKPRTYYHGTSKDVDFKNFKIGRHGAWFTNDPESASQYAEQNDSQNYKYEHGKYIKTNTASRVVPTYLKAENPYTGEYSGQNTENYKKAQSDWFDQLRARGYDSWVPDSVPGLAVMLKHPHQIKSAVGNIGTFDPSKPDINKAAGGEVDYGSYKNPTGLYSQAAKAVGAIKQAKGSPQDMLRAISSTPGVKKDELQWSEAQDKFAGQQSITKDDLAKHFQNSMPKIQETTYGAEEPSEDNDWSTTSGTRYGEYTLPGGKGYREVLMHLPKKDVSIPDIEKEMGFTRPLTTEQQDQVITKWKGRGPEANYNSSHWAGTPNVVAHLRMSDRRTPEGQDALHLEELQSDWGQDARKHGYGLTPEEDAHHQALTAENSRLHALMRSDKLPDDEFDNLLQQRKPILEEMERLQSKKEGGVPNAPYINKTENWTDLGLKRALTEAARGGYDKLVYTPGEEQARRYNLSRHVGHIEYEHDPITNTHAIDAYDPQGVAIKSDHSLTPKEIEQHYNKDIAEKVLSGHGDPVNGPYRDWKRISNLDTKLGGEGMKGYYDKLLPDRLLKLAREHDPEAQLGHHVVERRNEGDHTTLPGLTITPRMREGILRHGFKAFADGGAVDGDGDDTYPETGSIYSTPDGFAGGGLVMDKQKAIRRALMTATSLHRADGGETEMDNPRAVMGGNNPPAEPRKYNLISNGQRNVSVSETSNPKRIKFDAEGPGGVKGIITPRHMWEGGNGKHGRIAGMNEINQARAQVYGAEPRDPLNVGQIEKAHKQALDEHFAKPVSEQISAEKTALKRLKAAKHISQGANTLDEGEKLDTVKHEFDDEGRSYVAYGAKGTAGHAVYSSGADDDQKLHVVNTCPGQTGSCGGGVDKNGIVDTRRGMCFAPKAEAQYAGASVRRACHTQAKHDPAMTKDWVLAHTGSLRDAAIKADKTNNVVLFRPNVLDETDRSTRYVIKGLNAQRKESGKPSIIGNSYGKTTELHDPENGYYITHSNIGPKTKLGASVSEHIKKDRQRIRSTITAADASGRDFVNEEGHKTPPKNSYMVTDVSRDSPMDAATQKAVTHAKYWSTGRNNSELSPSERNEGPEGHFDGGGKPTTADKAHYGHATLNGLRYDYQKQHILHPRYVKVGENDDGSDHMIPTDSRFKDDDFLPENRFKTKNGKKAGAIILTTPTKSTSGVERRAAFTHHIGQEEIKHAVDNNGEYEIDAPHKQEAARGNEYKAPFNPAGKYAHGGAVHSHDDEFESTAFPSQSFQVQLHNAHKGLNEEDEAAEKRGYKKNKSPIEQDIVQRALRIAQQVKKPSRT
jgi:hypothetical protein